MYLYDKYTMPVLNTLDRIYNQYSGEPLCADDTDKILDGISLALKNVEKLIPHMK